MLAEYSPEKVKRKNAGFNDDLVNMDCMICSSRSCRGDEDRANCTYDPKYRYLAKWKTKMCWKFIDKSKPKRIYIEDIELVCYKTDDRYCVTPDGPIKDCKECRYS